MTFTLMLTANIVLDLALILGLAYAMTRPAKLTPHRPGVAAEEAAPVHRQPRARARGERVPGRLATALD